MTNFSVLISVYDKEVPDFLRQSLDSVFNQTLTPNEVVIVEDGKLNDGLLSVINEIKAKHDIIKIVPIEHNGGLGNALNIGLKHCSNEIIARMDSDDISKPNRFEKQVAEFEKDPALDVISSWMEEFIHDPNETSKIIKKVPENNDEIFKFAKNRNPINHPTAMFKKSKVEECGGYQKFYLFEDYYLWTRMLKNGCKFKNRQESLLYFRTTNDTYSRRGGLTYLKSEIKLQLFMHKIKYINTVELIENIAIRSAVRLMPNNIGAFFYKRLLRKN